MLAVADKRQYQGRARPPRIATMPMPASGAGSGSDFGQIQMIAMVNARGQSQSMHQIELVNLTTIRLMLCRGHCLLLVVLGT
jgi:hypothetical protein